MTIKEFILKEKNNFTMDKVFIVTPDPKKHFIKCALYRHINEPNKVVLYINDITRYEFDINTGEFIPESIMNYPHNIDIIDEEVSLTNRQGFIKLIRESIKYFMKNKKYDNALYKSLLEECKKFGGRISYRSNDKKDLMMFVGVSSTDEEFYDVFVYQDKDNKPKICYSSVCIAKTFIEPEDYDEKTNNFIEFIKNNRGEIVNIINENYSDVMLNGINFGIDMTHYRKYDRDALLHLISTYKKLFRYGKMADVLMDILDNQVSDFDRCNVIQVLYEVYNDYVQYYRDLEEDYKRYYVEYFWEKCNAKLQTKLNTIQNDHLKSYYIGFCETFKRVLLEEANIKKN